MRDLPASPSLPVRALKQTHRETVKTDPKDLAISLRSVHKSQHRPKGSTQRSRGVVLSRQYLHPVEVYWFALMDPWKTCVPVSIFKLATSHIL